MSDQDGAPFFEDLDLGDACIPEIAKPNANNSVTWTTKVHLKPDSSESPLGQMSFWAKVMYVITPGKDKTALTHPDGNRNCDAIIEPMHRGFIDQCAILDKVALDHAIKYKDVYWEGQELTDKQVAKRHRKLIVQTKDGDKLVFRMKLRPTVRKNKKGELVKNPRATVMTRVVNDVDADEPTSIDEIHNDSSSQDYVQNVCNFVSFFRSDAYFGINVVVPQGWHKTIQHASFKRNRGRRSKRSRVEEDSSSAQVPTKVTRVEKEEQASKDHVDDDIADDFDDYE